MSTVTLTDRWSRLCSDSALATVFRESLLYRLTVGRAELVALCLIMLLMPLIPVTATAVLILAAGVLFLVAGVAADTPALVPWRSLGATARPPAAAVQADAGVPGGDAAAERLFRDSPGEPADHRPVRHLYCLLLDVPGGDQGRAEALHADRGLPGLGSPGGLLRSLSEFVTKPPVDPSWIDSASFPNITVRVFGTLNNPNILAQYLVPGIMFGLALAFQR